jgi:hypothetical protein
VLHLLLQVGRAEVAVEVGGHPGVLVAHDPLNRRENGDLGQVEERGQWTEQVLSAV